MHFKYIKNKFIKNTAHNVIFRKCYKCNIYIYICVIELINQLHFFCSLINLFINLVNILVFIYFFFKHI